MIRTLALIKAFGGIMKVPPARLDLIVAAARAAMTTQRAPPVKHRLVVVIDRDGNRKVLEET